MKTYLADAVYATDELILGSITLLTDSHEMGQANNVIHLDEETLKKLETFIHDSRKKANEEMGQAYINLLPEDLQWKAGIYGARQLDIDNLSHEEALRVMKALSAGRWERKESGCEGKLDYTATIGEWKIRLWGAGPPDSCRVVEEEYEIPAVPAKKVIRKRVICNKTPEPSND